MATRAISLAGLLVLAVCSCTSQRELDAQLHSAVLRGDVAQAQALIDDGAAIEHAANGEPVFDVAIIHTPRNRAQMLALLMDHGADPAATPGSGHALLMQAYRFNKLTPDVLDVLVAHGVDLEQEDADGNTLLISALGYPMPAATRIQMLLDKGPDVDHQNKRGETALHVAVIGSRSIDVINALIRHGADVNIRDNKGETALNKCSGREEGIWIALVEAGSDLTTLNHEQDTPLQSAARMRRFKVARLMIARGADVNAKDRWGSTVLFGVASAGELELVKQIVSKGADVNVANRGGFTPLHFACAGYRKDVAAYLISQGADINAMTNNEVTPLGYARVHQGDPSPEGQARKAALIEYLVEQGAEQRVGDSRDTARQPSAESASADDPSTL